MKVNINDRISVNIDIPEEMDAVEFLGLLQMAKKSIAVGNEKLEVTEDGRIRQIWDRQVTRKWWYDSETNKLLHLYDDNKTLENNVEKIAKELGRTHNSVLCKIKYMRRHNQMKQPRRRKKNATGSKKKKI